MAPGEIAVQDTAQEAGDAGALGHAVVSHILVRVDALVTAILPVTRDAKHGVRLSEILGEDDLPLGV